MMRVIRIIWICLSFLVLALPVLTGGFIGLCAGAVRGFKDRRRLFLEMRLGALNGAIQVAKWFLPRSSKIYSWLFARNLYKELNFPKNDHEFLIVGHRGSPSDCCENTLESYARALSHGANALEIDLCMTEDGLVVIWHDWDPDSLVSLFRESGLEDHQAYRPKFPDPPLRKAISKLASTDFFQLFTYTPRQGPQDAYMQQRAPTFREFLEWAVGQKHLHAVFLDIKIPPTEVHLVKPFMQSVVQDLRDVCPGFESIFMTIYPEVHDAMRKFDPDQLYCFDMELTNSLMTPDPATLGTVSTVKNAQKFSNPYCSVGRPTFLMLAPWEVYHEVISHDLKYRFEQKVPTKLIAWTINDPDEQKWLFEAGVDGILTDLPKQLARIALRKKARAFLRTPFTILKQRPQTP